MKWTGGRARHVHDLTSVGEEQVMEDVLAEASLDEIREFLEADLADVPADPEFKEQLRQRLWKLVQARQRRGVVAKDEL